MTAGARRVRAVLFDLDGTLIDSAPDLAGACQDMRSERGLPFLPYELLRARVGSGARGMVAAAFELAPGDAGYEALRDEFLRRYELRMMRDTCVFPGVPSMLSQLARRGLPWGIVTNKAARYAEPIVSWLELRPAAIVCGDTTAHAKPHPAPLIEAARRLGVEAAHCVYIGDDLRDVQAGRAASMGTIAASWGYLGVGVPVAAWQADHVIDSPEALLPILGAS